MLEARIQQHFIDGADLQYQLADTLANPVNAATQALLAGLTGGGKVMVAGLGISRSLADYFTALLVGGFERERPALAAVLLSEAVPSLCALPDVQPLARQVQAWGTSGDVLVVISLDGQEPALAQVLGAAHDRDMVVVAVTGRGGGLVKSLLRETDVLVDVPLERPARVREMQQLVLHCLCDAIDAQLLGDQELM